MKMKYSWIVLFLFLVEVSMAQNFKQSQLNYLRVKEAYAEKEQFLLNLYKSKGFLSLKNELFLRAFKKEEILEIWAKNLKTNKFELLVTYKFCANSGVLGPKRKEGDLQIPEGFYYINLFHPSSAYHLGLKINYPNESDKILSDKKRPGSDILIHGNCCTIGCIPITDDKIKELYILCVEAKNAGQEKIPVHIFPCRLDAANYNGLISEFNFDTKKLEFWKNLKPIYDFFVENSQIPQVKVDNFGKYFIQK